MRRLTFKGYLRSYVRYLSGENTLALRRLAALVETNRRLTEPLLLWVVKEGREKELAELLKTDGSLLADLRLLAKLEKAGQLEAVLTSADSRLSPRYLKAWHSYKTRRDAHKRDRTLKLEARRRALDLEAKKKVTRYRMAKDLGLNGGNLHAFLAQGNPDHLSLQRVHGLLRYLESA